MLIRNILTALVICTACTALTAQAPKSKSHEGDPPKHVLNDTLILRSLGSLGYEPKVLGTGANGSAYTIRVDGYLWKGTERQYRQWTLVVQRSEGTVYLKTYFNGRLLNPELDPASISPALIEEMRHYGIEHQDGVFCLTTSIQNVGLSAPALREQIDDHIHRVTQRMFPLFSQAVGKEA